MTDAETTPPRFGKGGTVTSRDYNLHAPADVREIREALTSWNRTMLMVLLSIIFALSVALWLADAVSTVAVLWAVASVPAWAGLLVHLLISLVQKYLLHVKVIIKKVFGEAARVSAWGGVLIVGLVMLAMFVNVSTSSVGGLYVLQMASYNYQSIGAQIVAVLAALVVANAELIAVISFLALRWLWKH